ncbi:MAG: hypothetical protein Q9191_004963 [Dirinaria sp. TL-2023a]
MANGDKLGVISDQHGCKQLLKEEMRGVAGQPCTWSARCIRKRGCYMDDACRWPSPGSKDWSGISWIAASRFHSASVSELVYFATDAVIMDGSRLSLSDARGGFDYCIRRERGSGLGTLGGAGSLTREDQQISAFLSQVLSSGCAIYTRGTMAICMSDDQLEDDWMTICKADDLGHVGRLSAPAASDRKAGPGGSVHIDDTGRVVCSSAQMNDLPARTLSERSIMQD